MGKKFIKVTSQPGSEAGQKTYVKLADHSGGWKKIHCFNGRWWGEVDVPIGYCHNAKSPTMSSNTFQMAL